MQVAHSTICLATIIGWYLTTCSAEFITHTYTHIVTHSFTQTCSGLEGRDEDPSYQPYTETWRSRPGDRDHTSDHLTRGYTHTCIHTATFTHTHTHTDLCPFFVPYPKPCFWYMLINVHT